MILQALHALRPGASVDLSIKVSRISYGIPIGGELEYVDGNTIARAIQGRIEI